MTQKIVIFDSNDDGTIGEIAEKYQDVVKFYSNQKTIKNTLGKYTRKVFPAQPSYSFVIAHEADIERHLADLRSWASKNSVGIVLYSGGASGKGEVRQRAEVRRRLEDFIIRVQDGAPNPLHVFFADKSDRSISQWLHVYRHQFGNIYAPIDYLALLYQGGDIDKLQFSEIKKKLLARIKTSLSRKSRNLVQLQDDLLKGDVKFQDVESVEFSSDENYIPIRKLISFPLIHIDDEISNGWSDLFQAVIGDNYIPVETPKKALSRIKEYADQDCVVFLDLRMPNEKGNAPSKETGISTLKSIRSRWPLLPVYIFSADTDYASYGEAMNAGASGYIVKYARSIEHRPDKELYVELWQNVRSVRLSAIKNCIGSAFSSILNHERFEDISSPGKRDLSINAINQFSHSLRLTSFDQLALDDPLAVASSGYLIILMYQMIEHFVKPRDENSISEFPITQRDPYLQVPRSSRNYVAHSNRSVAEERVWPGMREILLVASMLIKKWGDLLSDTVWANNHLDRLYSLLVVSDMSVTRTSPMRTSGAASGGFDENIDPVERISEFLHWQGADKMHSVIRMLATDCHNSKNLSLSESLRWMKYDHCRINLAKIRLVV